MRQVTHALLTRPPLSCLNPSENFIKAASFDLHVLGTPPAFILSQDQTLMFKFVRSKSVWLILPFYCCFRFLFSEISLRTFCSVWNFQGCITVYLSRCCSSYWKYFQKNFSFLSLRQLIEFIISSSDCQELFELFSKFIAQSSWANGEGGIWTLAPLLTTCTLSRGVPSAILGTSPCADSHLPIWQSHDCIWRIPSTAMLRKTICWNLTERVGFEPTRPFGQTVFKTASLWPLRYLSGSFGSSFELAALHQRKMYSIRALQECQHSFSFFLLFC